MLSCGGPWSLAGVVWASLACALVLLFGYSVGMLFDCTQENIYIFLRVSMPFREE